MTDPIIAVSLWAEANYLAAVSSNPAKRAFWRAVLERAESQLEARVKEIGRDIAAAASGNPDAEPGGSDSPYGRDCRSD